MPGTSIGNATRYSTATAWLVGQVRALGSLATPSTPNGLVFICTGAGTPAASQPNWNSVPYPTLGTVFTDGGGVQWTTYGTQPGAFPPIAQLPVDGDPPLAFSQVTAEQTILDEIAWLVANTGLLAGNNSWTGNNYFESGVQFYGSTALESTAGPLYFLNQTSTTPSWQVNGNPGSGLLQVSQAEVASNIYARTYVGTTADATYFTINAAWNGSQWAYDVSTVPASLMVVTPNGLEIFQYAASGTSPWSTGSWTAYVYLNMTGNSLQLAVPLSTSQPAYFNGTFQAVNVSNLNGVPSAGQYGSPLVVDSTAQTSGGSGTSPIALSTSTALIGTGSSRFTGKAGWYRLTVWATSTTTGDSSHPPALTVGWSYGVIGAATKNVAMILDGTDNVSGQPYFTYHTEFFNAANGGISCIVYTLGGSGPYTGWALLEAIY